MRSPEIRVQLLGDFDLCSEPTPIPPLESPRVRSLLAYLLLHRAAPQPRHRIAFLLWPDSTEAQARTNLRHVLHTLLNANIPPSQKAEPRSMLRPLSTSPVGRQS